MSCNPHRVRINKVVERKVTLDRHTVTRINDNRPITRVDPPNRRVVVNEAKTILAPTVEQRIVNIGTPGIPGKQGASGGISVPPVGFNFGTAGHIVWVAPVAGTFTEARVDITEEFDGIGAEVFAGVVGNVAIIMPPELNNPYEIGEYGTVADFQVSAGAGLWIQVTPGSGASRGTGVLYVTFVPET